MRMSTFRKLVAADVQDEVFLVVYCNCKIVYQKTGFHIFQLEQTATTLEKPNRISLYIHLSNKYTSIPSGNFYDQKFWR